MTEPRKEMRRTHTLNEWAAITNALRHMAATYVTEHGGVDLVGLADRITPDLIDAWTRIEGGTAWFDGRPYPVGAAAGDAELILTAGRPDNRPGRCRECGGGLPSWHDSGCPMHPDNILTVS